MRPIKTPATGIKRRYYAPAGPLREVVLQPPGRVPARALAPARAVDEKFLAAVARNLRDLPRLTTGKGRGAIDVRLERPDGTQVKEGVAVLEGPHGVVGVPLDPSTRRFRAGDLPAGEYQVRASSARHGRSAQRVTVRGGDVARVALRLDGLRLQGRGKQRFTIPGRQGKEVFARVTDRDTRKVVFEGRLAVAQGLVEVEVPFGRLHWDFDDGEARSCYDTEAVDLGALLPPLHVDLRRFGWPWPDPPDPRFASLPVELHGVVSFLPRIGVRSMEELAAAEPEDLMHRANALRDRDTTPVYTRQFANAVTAARATLGLTGAEGRAEVGMRLARGGTFTHTFLPKAPGDLDLEVNIPSGAKAELAVEGPEGTTKRDVAGLVTLRLAISANDVAQRRGIRVMLRNPDQDLLTGVVRARLPERSTHRFIAAPPSTEARIRHILEHLAEQNPGLSTVIPPSVMEPENIRMWLDRAKSWMHTAGVCSMNDLGRFRLEPGQVLRPGIYVAPVVQPARLDLAPVLTNYALAEAIQDAVLWYRPNDTLHDTAVVLAGAWDIRGQDIVIGQEVRELVVIVGSIQHDGASRITWETPTLPQANAYWPNPAPRGANGAARGEDGGSGGDGDPSPHPSKNGGANAVTPAPIVTMYILDATNNLPPLDLRGESGGAGGRGQDGGRGGDAARGRNADGTLLGGCCRGVGWGGDGGRGGNAGRGGKGGSGGEGGKVTVLTTAASLGALEAAPPSIDVNPGVGGPGGSPGTAGLGGRGGPAGSADCEPWCSEHPERVGSDGATGAPGTPGLAGDAGPAIAEDAIQFLPITEEQWLQEFNNPHILALDPTDAEPGETVSVTGQNFDPSIDRVFFDGRDVAPVASATAASFAVPTDSDGSYHPVVIRPPGLTDRRSNRALLRVLPKLDPLPSTPRWVDNQAVNLSGLAFVPGLQALAEDRSVSPPASYALPVTGVTRTSIAVQVPGGNLGDLRGVRRIVVRNPDEGSSRDERVVRIGDTIVINVAAFRVVGSTPGTGTTRTAAEIAALFAEGTLFGVAGPWQQARIVFRLVQPVADVATTDDRANMWPIINPLVDRDLFDAAPGVLGAINVFFVRDVEFATAYCYFGGGPAFIGDEGGPLGPVDWQQVVAHELGHGLCLRHICDGSGEGAGTFFDRECEDGDEQYLMYPFWDTADGMTIHAGQVDAARRAATHFEQGKLATLPADALFQLANTVAQCQAEDTEN